MSDSRKQMKPDRAVQRYLADKKPEWSDSTYYNNSSALKRFLAFCENEDLDNIANIDGFHITDFKQVRREEDEINEVTLYNNLSSLRTFLKWCSAMGLVESWVVEDMVLNDPDDKVRSDKIDPEEAEAILKYLDQFRLCGGPVVSQAAADYQLVEENEAPQEVRTAADKLRTDGGESDHEECDCGEFPCWLCAQSGRRAMPE